MNIKIHFLKQLIKDIISLNIVRTKLKKDLGLLDVFCISTGAMIGSGLFVLVSVAYLKTGPSVILSYAIASLMVIPTILAKAELVTALPKTGGIFVFTDRSMGPLLGTLAGLSAWFSLAFKTAFALLGIGIFMSLISPELTFFQEKILAVVCCLFFTFINIVGVKLTGRFQSYMVLLLIGLLFLYICIGVFSIDLSRFSNFAPHGTSAIFLTAGMVFISYAGTTKIAAVAGEVKNPEKILPIGIFLSWGIVSLLYIGVIAVTVGIEDPSELMKSLTPISLGGHTLMGYWGFILMTLAGLLAFVTTGNAGILAASRDPMAMSKSGLLPRFFGKVSKQGTPWASILVTSTFMIATILFLDLEMFVKTASTLKLILFSLANFALIFMRVNDIDHYKPSFRAPFCPWMQIIGIGGYIFLIVNMGIYPLLFASFFLLCGILWYFLYAYPKIKKEYAILQVLKDTADIESHTYLEDEELREALIAEDEIAEALFELKLRNSAILDLTDTTNLEEVYYKAAEALGKQLHVEPIKLYEELIDREKKGHIIGRPSFALIFSRVPGRSKFKISFVRTKKQINYSPNFPPTRAFIIVVSSEEIRHFYLRSLMWLIKLAEKKDFETRWNEAKDVIQLHKEVLSLSKK